MPILYKDIEKLEKHSQTRGTANISRKNKKARKKDVYKMQIKTGDFANNQRAVFGLRTERRHIYTQYADVSLCLHCCGIVDIKTGFLRLFVSI